MENGDVSVEKVAPNNATLSTFRRRLLHLAFLIVHHHKIDGGQREIKITCQIREQLSYRLCYATILFEVRTGFDKAPSSIG